MKKRLIVIKILLLFACGLFGEVVPVEKAKVIAKNFYYERRSLSSDIIYYDINLNDNYTIYNENKPVIYIFNVNNNEGFIIISAESNVYPVLGYSFNGRYDINDDDTPPAFTDLLNSCKEQIIYVRNHELSGNKNIDCTWNNYSSEITGKSVKNVDSLLSTTWNQGCYYNDSCPFDVNENVTERLPVVSQQHLLS